MSVPECVCVHVPGRGTGVYRGVSGWTEMDVGMKVGDNSTIRYEKNEIVPELYL